jgi:hypothetical protein
MTFHVMINRDYAALCQFAVSADVLVTPLGALWRPLHLCCLQWGIIAARILQKDRCLSLNSILLGAALRILERESKKHFNAEPQRPQRKQAMNSHLVFGQP